MIKLDKRLNAVLNQIPQCGTLVDVGCDHGKLCVQSVISGIAQKAVAVDVSAKSLEKARILAEKCGITECIRFSCSDGFEGVLEGENDVCVIAGMGGLEIIEILKSKTHFNTYIFTPHSHSVELRRFLNGQFVTEFDEKICVGKKFYDIIKCHRGKSDYDERFIYFGASSKDNKDFCDYLDNRITTLKGLLHRVDAVRKIELEKEIKLAEEFYEGI